MKVRVVKQKEGSDLPIGSCVNVTKTHEDYYVGEWSSMAGTYIVSVYKEFVKVIED